jgi:hypothetical protein
MFSFLLSFIQKWTYYGMALESRELLVDDLKIYSSGLINALKQDKLVEARGYVSDLTSALEPVSSYLESQIKYEEMKPSPELVDPRDIARTEGDRAIFAAKRAEEKVESLERLVRETSEESKRLKKIARKARKEAAKARKAAEKAEKAENKAETAARTASENAAKANQAARHS